LYNRQIITRPRQTKTYASYSGPGNMYRLHIPLVCTVGESTSALLKQNIFFVVPSYIHVTTVGYESSFFGCSPSALATRALCFASRVVAIPVRVVQKYVNHTWNSLWSKSVKSYHHSASKANQYILRRRITDER